MTDEQEKSASNKTDDSPGKESEGPRCGELLGEARREQEIGVAEIAKELHLDEHKVRALERNDFDTLGAPVFAKGHLRKYAELVGVDVNDILTDYYRLTRQDNLPPVVVARRRMRREVSPGPWIAVIVVIIVVAAAYYWFSIYSLQLTTPVSAPEAGPPPQQDPATVYNGRAEPDIAVSGRPDPGPAETESPAAEPEPVAADFEVEDSAPPESEPLADGEVRLSLSFSGECWTEISDATGQRLFFEMGRAGETVELTGVAPFAALFGDVDNVSVRVDGNDYPVTTNNPGSRTARLTINQP
jgi:cytoskeleton protein RodZ